MLTRHLELEEEIFNNQFAHYYWDIKKQWPQKKE